MSDPLSLVPFALAARAGRVDGVAVSALVAAGVTLLQRAAPVVRALADGPAAILLAHATPLLVALAASDGHEAVLLAPDASPGTLRRRIDHVDARVIFTTAACVPLLDGMWASDHGAGANPLPGRPILVLLDEAPRRARVRLPERVLDVDLGSHVGLTLEGDQEAAGREEAFVRLALDGEPAAELRLTHRDTMTRCRDIGSARRLSSVDTVHATLPIHTPDGFLAVLAVLLAGGTLVGEADAPADRVSRGSGLSMGQRRAGLGD